MSLLDVPPEILQGVFEIFVSSFGVRKAMKARQVSKTFLSYINEEIFARQPVSKLRAKVPNRLLQKNLALFLERRTVARYGAPDLLPSVITRIVDYLISVVQGATEESRGAWTRRVIAVIVERCPDALRIALASTPTKVRKHFQDDTRCLALAISIQLDDQALVTQLLELGADPWRSSHLFGKDALYLATQLRAMQVVKILLSTPSASRIRHDRRRRSRIIVDCTYLALILRDPNLAIELFSWHIQHLNDPSCTDISFLVERAVAHDALAFLQAMQRGGCLDPGRAPHTTEIIEGLFHNPQPLSIFRHLESEGFLSRYRRYRRYSYHKTRPLIDLAVHHNCVPLAEAVLSLGHHVYTADGLRKAISKNELPLVQAFLDNDADPEGVESDGIAYHRSTCELARPGSTVYKLVREAVQEKVRLEGEEYTAPTFMVWDVKRQKDVPVRYTYHAPDL